MLKRDKVAQALEKLSDKIFQNYAADQELGQRLWRALVADQNFLDRINAHQGTIGLPSWTDKIDQVISIKNDIKQYAVLAVDGSQIYPDRHVAGAECFLINAGACLLSYGKTGNVTFFSEPKLYLPEQAMPPHVDAPFTVDVVDMRREELELEFAINTFSKINGTHGSFLCLFDGSLIFGHLDNKQQELKDYFMFMYMKHLRRLYREQLVNASYISMSKSRELVGLVRLHLCKNKQDALSSCQGNVDECPCKQVDNLFDIHMLGHIIEPGYRTIVFHNRSKITEYYPVYLKPCFFYLNVGPELVRIEIPAWVAQDSQALALVEAVCFDQAKKGFGYPVCLAEAHEQAVVKGPDREFFYHLLRKIGIAQSRPVFFSQKALKKRGMGI